MHMKMAGPASVIALLLFLCPGISQAQTAKQTVTLELRNGKTGHPIWWRGSPYAFVGRQIESAEDFEDRGKGTNLLGKLKIDVTGASPPLIKVWVDYLHRDCRFPESQASATRTFTYSGSTLAALPAYSIDEIRSKGVVSENDCGGKRQAAMPGVLVIYVIPATFRELWYK